MILYHIYLVDPYKLLQPNGVSTSVAAQLKLLFDPIATDAKFAGAMVDYGNGVVSPAHNELLVYVMPPGKSIVALSPGGTPQTDPTSDGYTNFRAGASEVYAKHLDHPVMLAKLAFHECMHNKLRLGQTSATGPDGLHSSQDGLGQESITESTPLTSRNSKAMTAALARPVPQWSDGIQQVLTGMNDPLSPFYSI
jgi:hypothetical protein